MVIIGQEGNDQARTGKYISTKECVSQEEDNENMNWYEMEKGERIKEKGYRYTGQKREKQFLLEMYQKGV